MNQEVFIQLGLALLLGMLVGLQRERTEGSIAGIRTFPLITVFGTICALLGRDLGGWILAAGLVAVAAMVALANFIKVRAGEIDPGLTTEMAVLVMFGAGAYLVLGEKAVAVAMGAIVAVLLQWKQPLHQFVDKVGEKDMKAIIQFVLISLVILPVVPNQTYGPFNVLNPYKIWLLVVLIVGISFCGYVAYKLFGARAGTLLGGLIGGLVSSTATTVSYSRRTRETPGVEGLAALVIMLASSSVFVRVLIEISAVAPQHFARMSAPILMMMASLALIAGGAFFFTNHQNQQMPDQGNPAQLKSALVFGVLYGVVLLAAAAAKEHLGQRGLFMVAMLSGLTDMDAITLSTSQLVADERLHVDTGWRVILAASMSNLVSKACIVAVMGRPALFARIVVMFGMAMVAGFAILWLWPTHSVSTLP